MNPIESKIREAIAATPNADMETRNRIYLAARAAILKQKNGHADVAMNALFDGITNIEREFTAGKNEPHRQNTKEKPAEPETVSLPIERRSQTPHVVDTIKTDVKSLFDFRDPSRKNVLWALLILSGIGVFLFASFMLASSGVANRNASPQDAGVATLFSVELPSEWEKLTDNPSELRLDGDGNTVVVVAPTQRNKNAVLYGRELIAVTPGQEFLMRVEFQSETGGPGPGVRAGFVAYDGNGESLTEGPENYIYFVDTAALGDRYLNDTTGNHVVSGLLITQRTYNSVQLPQETRQIRPVIQIIANGNNGKYRIRRISIKRIQ